MLFVRNHGIGFSVVFAALLLAQADVAVQAQSSDERPNILFILVDDLAWSDLACYGHAWHQTPRIDSLAKQGMRFTEAYSPAPICSAARASILTGKTTARLGFEFVVKEEPGRQSILPAPPLAAPPFTLALDLAEPTIAEHLQKLGYQTAYYGKWHLNPHYGGRYLAWSPTHGPQSQGFEVAEEDFGSHPYSRIPLADVEEAGKFYKDGLTEKAVAFMGREREKPFFMMVSHFYVHTPIQSPYVWLKRKYDRFQPAGVSNREKRIEYAAFIETLDHHVGELVDGLNDNGLMESTMVVFLSDNGGHPDFTANGPLRGSKWNLYEGGIRVPMIVRWPGNVQAGAQCDTPVIGYDLFDTFSTIAGGNTQSNPERDSQSFADLFQKEREGGERSLYWHFPHYHPEGERFGNAQPYIGKDDFAVSQTRPHSAIRKGDFKLIYFAEDQRCELYDLSVDLSESSDISGKRPVKTAELKKDLLGYLDSVNARRAEASPEGKVSR